MKVSDDDGSESEEIASGSEYEPDEPVRVGRRGGKGAARGGARGVRRKKRGGSSDEEGGSSSGEEWGRAKRASRGRGGGAGRGRGKKRKTEGSDSDAGSGSDQPKKKRKSGGGGFNKSLTLSEDLAAIVGAKEAPRHEVVKQMWAYIKENNLQDPKNKQFAICDEKLQKVIGTKKFKCFGMAKYLKDHMS